MNVAALFAYPVKSCGALALERARLVPGEFPDVAPVLVTALATLGELDGGVTMERFRPNVVLAGSRPREELEWTRIETRAVALECEAPCARCKAIGAETLRAVHRALGGHFGVYCRVACPGPLARGESVTCA